MKLRVRVVLLAACAVLPGCKNARDNVSAVQTLKDNETQWNTDFASKDAARIGTHYAEDAVLMVSGQNPTVGKDAITAEFKAMMTDPAFSLQIHTEKAVVAASADLGFTQGTYNLTVTNSADHSVVHDTGSYVTTYRKGSDGTWKAVSDVSVSSVPTSPPPSK